MIRIDLTHNSFIEIHENFVSPNFNEVKDAIEWKQKSLNIQGKIIPFPRLTAFYGNHKYDYSGVINQAALMPEILKNISIKINEAGYANDAVLCNFYRNGNDSVSWHSDDEKQMPEGHYISSLSLGCTRSFKIKGKDKELACSFALKNGDLLVMGGNFQKYYQHCVPKEANKEERINLTFRIIK